MDITSRNGLCLLNDLGLLHIVMEILPLRRDPDSESSDVVHDEDACSSITNGESTIGHGTIPYDDVGIHHWDAIENSPTRSSVAISAGRPDEMASWVADYTAVRSNTLGARSRVAFARDRTGLDRDY